MNQDNKNDPFCPLLKRNTIADTYVGKKKENNSGYLKLGILKYPLTFKTMLTGTIYTHTGLIMMIIAKNTQWRH